AVDENVTVEHVRENVASGKICIPLNNKNINKRKVVGIGKGLSTKVNVNIGGSPDIMDIELEQKKLELAVKHKADAIMDLSVGPKSQIVRSMVFDESQIPVGTVPIYEVISNLEDKKVTKLTADGIFEVIEKQCEEGVDFITVHCGVTEEIVKNLMENRRTAGIVSRGGALIAEWIIKNKKENPLFTEYDRLIKIVKKHDVTLSLGDGLRPGCIADSTDWAQITELKLLGELAKRAWESGVQVMIEGPGHIPLHEVEKNIKLQKEYCYGAPFYVLGPIVTDIAPGYDHITSAIGGAIAASCGADFLCYVTPSEHIHLPDDQDMIDGLIGARIAAHSGDIVKNVQGAKEWDLDMAKARKALNWEKQKNLSINPDVFAKRMKNKPKNDIDTCTMCGEFCSMKRMNECL
ncbi:phosphomethylpyrimidine synthase ThiC, partial [bacterium]